MPNRNDIPKYRDNTGALIVLSTGIGERFWGAFAVKPNGSLRRLQAVEMTSREEAERQLEILAERKGWEEIDAEEGGNNGTL